MLTPRVITGGKKLWVPAPKPEKYKPKPESNSKEAQERMEGEKQAQTLRDKKYDGSPVKEMDVIIRLENLGCNLAVIDYFTKAMCPESPFYWISPAKLLGRIDMLIGEYGENGAQRLMTDLARGQMDYILHDDWRFAGQINQARSEYGLLRNLSERERKECDVHNLLNGCVDQRIVKHTLGMGSMDDNELDRLISRLYTIEGRTHDELRRVEWYAQQTKTTFPGYERMKIERLLRPTMPGEECLGIELLKIQIISQKFMEIGVKDIRPGRIARETAAQSLRKGEVVMYDIDFNDVLGRIGHLAAKIARLFGEKSVGKILNEFISENGLLTLLTGDGFEEKEKGFFATQVKAGLGQRQSEK